MTRIHAHLYVDDYTFIYIFIRDVRKFYNFICYITDFDVVTWIKLDIITIAWVVYFNSWVISLDVFREVFVSIGTLAKSKQLEN